MKGIRKLRKLGLPGLATMLVLASAEPAQAEECSSVSIARDQLPARLNRYVLEGSTIRLASPILRTQLPEAVQFEDCGDGIHYAILMDQLYLIRQAEISAVVACFRLAASSRRIRGTASSGETRNCP